MMNVNELIMSLPPAKRQFLQWLETANPSLYVKVIDEAGKRLATSGVAGLGQTTTTTAASSSWWDSISNALKSIGTAASTIVPTVLNAQTQQKVLNLQLQRAASGLAPIDTSQITLPPTATATVGLSSGTTALLWGGVAVLGVFLLMRMSR